MNILLNSKWWKASQGRDHVIVLHHPNAFRLFCAATHDCLCHPLLYSLMCHCYTQLRYEQCDLVGFLGQPNFDSYETLNLLIF